MNILPIANPVQPLIDVFDHVLVFFHDTVGFSWGFSIIALTIVVRAALIPLTLKQFKSMQALQRLSPEIKALQAKYKDDRQRLNQEMMKFYQENKVNPFGSCLPLVLQLPVFFSLFYMLRKDLKLDICPGIVKYAAQHGTTVTNVACNQVDPGSAKFLFIPDLTAHATGWVLAVLLVLYVGSQLLSSVLMSVTADRNQRFIMIALPFVFVPFIQGFPAGLLVYWITTNFWTVGQQYIIRRGAGLPVLGAPGSGPVTATAGAAAAVRRQGARGPETQGQAETERERRRRRGARAAGAARERSASAPAPAAQEEDRKAQMSSDVVESTVQEVLEEVVTALGLKGEVEVGRDGDVVTGTVHGHDLGLFIGRHGQTIDAVQHLVFRIVLTRGGGAPAGDLRVVVDAEGYRARREEALQRLADQAAEDARRQGRPVALDVMTASERKLVHEYLRDRGDVETYSEGEEPDRHLVVAPLVT